MHINDILSRPDLQAIRRRFERLHEKGAAPEDCWLWKSGRDKPNQYPAFPVGGKPPKGRLFAAMSVGYVLYNGPLAEGDEVLHHRHTCDNRRCVNPAHIVLGTHLDNMRDMRERDRQNRGERNGKAVLTEQQVLAIRCDARRQRDIAAIYGISQASVSFIKNGVNWRYL